MKTPTYIVLGLALAGLTACVDLNEKLVGSVTTQYFSSGAGLDAAVQGDYAQLRGFFGREESFAVTEFGTDIETNGDQGSYQYENTYGGGLNASDGHYTFPWNNFYRNINTSNAVIGRAPGVSDMDPATKATRIAEAKFLRALSYFWLVRMYGPVPLTTTESQGASNLAHRSPVDSVYLQIVQDLKDAIAGLPVAQPQYGRATKGAAEDLLARVLLTRAYHPYPYEAANASFYLASATFLRESGATSASDFAAAKAWADSVINSGQYHLLTNYVDIFCGPLGPNGTGGPGAYCPLPSNEQNGEIIFAVQYSTVSGQFTPGLGNTNFVQPLSYYDDRQGMVRNCWDGRGFRRVRPTLYARNLWQRWTDSTHSIVLDTRYDGTFQSVWYANATASGACYQGPNASRMNGYASGTCQSGGLPLYGGNCSNGQAFLPGDTAIFQPGYAQPTAAADSAYRLSHKYAIYEPCTAEPCPNTTTTGQYDIFRYPTMKKWQDDQRPDFNNLDGGRDVILQRLGQTYLTAAEAACAGSYGQAACSNPAAAQPYIAALRRRAADCQGRFPGCTPGVETANQGALVASIPATIDLEFIMDEYAREAYGEYERWLDLARTGLWHRVVDDNWQASPAHGGFFTEAKHHLRPIPQAQIDLTAGGVQAFPQNPGY